MSSHGDQTGISDTLIRQTSLILKKKGLLYIHYRSTSSLVLCVRAGGEKWYNTFKARPVRTCKVFSKVLSNSRVSVSGVEVLCSLTPPCPLQQGRVTRVKFRYKQKTNKCRVAQSCQDPTLRVEKHRVRCSADLHSEGGSKSLCLTCCNSLK